MLTYDLESGKAQRRRRIRRNWIIVLAVAVLVVLLVTGICFGMEHEGTEIRLDIDDGEIATEKTESLKIAPVAVPLGSSKVTQYREQDGSFHSEVEIKIVEDDIATKSALSEEMTSPRSNKLYVIAVVPH